MDKSLTTAQSTQELSDTLKARGLAKKDITQKKPGEDAHKIGELSAEDRKKIASDMIALASAGSKKQLEEIQKKKELLELTGKSRTVEQVSLDEIETVTEAKKGGIPDYMAALPPEHQLRQLWEAGYRANSDGTLYNVADLENDALAKKRRSASKKNQLVFWGGVIVLQFVLLIGFMAYKKRLATVRTEIVRVVAKKGIPKNQPEVTRSYNKLSRIQWLPELENLLEVVNRMSHDFDRFQDNPEPGSYLEYIRRNDKTFNAREAMRWQARIIRKPPHARPKANPDPGVQRTRSANASDTPGTLLPPQIDGAYASSQSEYSFGMKISGP